jgi:hypothetical protein
MDIGPYLFQELQGDVKAKTPQPVQKRPESNIYPLIDQALLMCPVLSRTCGGSEITIGLSNEGRAEYDHAKLNH